jgi:hypothetical protein
MSEFEDRKKKSKGKKRNREDVQMDAVEDEVPFESSADLKVEDNNSSDMKMEEPTVEELDENIDGVRRPLFPPVNPLAAAVS